VQFNIWFGVVDAFTASAVSLFYALHFGYQSHEHCEGSTSMILLVVPRCISQSPFPFPASDSCFGSRLKMASISDVQVLYGVCGGSRRLESQNGGTKRRPCIIPGSLYCTVEIDCIAYCILHICCIFVSFIPVWVWLDLVGSVWVLVKARHSLRASTSRLHYGIITRDAVIPEAAPGWPLSNVLPPNRCHAHPRTRECDPKVGIYTQLRYSYLEPRVRGAHRHIYNSLLPLPLPLPLHYSSPR
jgi:hypothetical protein